MLILKGEWITNIGKDERELWVSAGFIVWSPEPTQFATKQQLISAGILGVYANPLRPDAKLPTHMLSPYNWQR